MRAFFKFGLVSGGLFAVASGCGATVTVSGECSYDGETYSVGESFADECNTCTCEAGGSVVCTKQACTEEFCSYNGQTFAVGESFDAGDGCNTCTCESADVVACTNTSCEHCSDIPPECPQPGDPSCESFAQCGANGWECILACDDCGDDLPPCPPPPEGCFWDGPVCIDGEWSCGDLICEGGCTQDPPLCDSPPGCWAEAFCSGDEWLCEIHCDDGSCEEQYPEGNEQVYQLILDECSCAPMAPCAQACQGFCASGFIGNACNNCIQSQVDNTSGCVVDAAFGDECQSSDQCSSYVDCVISEG